MNRAFQPRTLQPPRYYTRVVVRSSHNGVVVIRVYDDGGNVWELIVASKALYAVISKHVVLTEIQVECGHLISTERRATS